MNRSPPRKALPSRPALENGYGNGLPPNGYRSDNQFDYNSTPPPMSARLAGQEPGRKAIFESYRQDIMTGFEEEKPRYNPLNALRPQSSPLLNINDEIQVHLLVETALGDSKEYEILSQEEVDDLKRQVQSLTQRIQQTKSNLAIQSKYRDAALNMSRLYANSSRNSGDSGDGKKRWSLLGHNRTSSNEAREADQERQASERRCEEIAAELWSLEKRLMVPQNRLLKHTAGILQMTHKVPTDPSLAKGPQQGDIPGSPESMYTNQNARNSMDFMGEDDLFDERSLYRNAEAIWEEATREAPSQGPSKEQLKMIASTEQKLEDLNTRLRNVLVKSNPKRKLAPPPRSGEGSDPVQAFQGHLAYLEENISTIDREHFELMRGQQESGTAMSNLEQTETIITGLWDIIQSGEAEIRKRKLERRQNRSAQSLPPDEDDSPDEEDDSDQQFSIQAFSTKVQWIYTQATRLKDQKKVLQRQIKQQRELNSKSDATKDAELQQKVEELSRTTALLTRTEMDADAVREQLATIMEDLDAARQQERTREQSRSSEESAAVRQVQEELNQRINLNAKLEEELQDLKDDSSIVQAEMQAKIKDAESKIANLTKELTGAAASTTSVNSLVREKEQQIKDTQLDIQEKQQLIAKRDQELATLNQTLKSRDQQLQSKEQEIKERDEKFKGTEKELDEMNMEVARLKMEVTVARAELDGAYGSRAQRAAEATNPAVQKEISDLQLKNMDLSAEIAQLREKASSGGDNDANVKMLKKELAETIEEYEQMTKASIEWEKERELLESNIDKLRDAREALEVQLSDEKVKWLGMKSPAVDGGNPGSSASTSTMVLKNEFKKMMRDTRAESSKLLRAEQEQRRKLEDELRALKKQIGPGKSGLSQSYGST